MTILDNFKENYLNINDFAKHINRKRTSILYHIHNKNIKECVMLNGAWYISKTELENVRNYLNRKNGEENV